jgi:hypothetical protein
MQLDDSVAEELEDNTRDEDKSAIPGKSQDVSEFDVQLATNCCMCLVFKRS